MLHRVRSRPQLLLVSAERRPSCSDSASAFRRFLLLKSYCLSEILRALLHKSCFDLDIADRHFLLFARTLVAEDLRLSGCIFHPTFSVLRLKSHNMLCHCSSDVAYKSTSSASLKFVRQSDSESQIRIPAPFLGHLAKSSFSATRNTVFESDLDNGSPCFVPFSVLNTSLSLSVKTDLFCLSYSLVKKAYILWFDSQCPSASQSDLWLVESKARMKSTVEIHILTPHSWHFCSAIFNPAKWSSVWNDRLNPPWCSGCTRSSLGHNRLHNNVEKSL